MGVPERQFIQQQCPHNSELKQILTVIRITEDTLCRVAANFQCQPQTVLTADGLYIEHVLQ